jgi:hypothetical protein
VDDLTTPFVMGARPRNGLNYLISTLNSEFSNRLFTGKLARNLLLEANNHQVWSSKAKEPDFFRVPPRTVTERDWRQNGSSMSTVSEDSPGGMV